MKTVDNAVDIDVASMQILILCDLLLNIIIMCVALLKLPTPL